jgi:hypothetical protein
MERNERHNKRTMLAGNKRAPKIRIVNRLSQVHPSANKQKKKKRKKEKRRKKLLRCWVFG